MFDYLHKKIEWTDQDTGNIKWKANRLAKRRPTHTESMQVSKMAHEWLNIDNRKERINSSATDALCPCCGLEHEDQDDNQGLMLRQVSSN